MATSETTNLQLVKYGAGTDNFIRTDYNGNLDKIDTFAGNTNEAIANLESDVNTTRRDISGADEIKDCNNAEIGKCYNVYGSASHTPFTNVVAVLYTYGNNAVKSQTISDGRKMYIRAFANNAWADWKLLALKSDFVKYNGNVTFNSSGIATVTMTGALYGSPVFVTLNNASATSVLISGVVSATDTVTITAYNTDTKAAYSGSRSVNILVIN
jgi:outer membrane murein-binding lipoprotein Lpp